MNLHLSTIHACRIKLYVLEKRLIHPVSELEGTMILVLGLSEASTEILASRAVVVAHVGIVLWSNPVVVFLDLAKELAQLHS